MRKNNVKSILILTILILGTIPLIYSDSSEENYMLNLINNERLSQGLKPLTMNLSLASAARFHSQDMVDRNFFNHVNPDGLNPSDRARNAGYNFIALAENICGNPSIDAGHSSLMNSPTHRANILNPSFREIGIGIVDGGPYGKMITQLFGTQLEHNVVSQDTTHPNESQGKPDLKISSIEVTGQYKVYKQVSMKIILTNSGKKNAESFIFSVFNGPPERGNQLGTINIPSLYVGQSSSINFNWTPQNEGDFTLYFILDYANNVDEENESNNIKTYNLSVKSTNTYPSQDEKINNIPTPTTNNLPDLHISINETTYDQVVYNGISSPVSFRIRNLGSAASYDIPVKIYVNGNLKSTSNVNQLLPSSYTDLITYLSFQFPGDNVIEIIIDPDNKIREISKSNNYIRFTTKVVSKSSNSTINENNTQMNQQVDLIIYPYYIIIEEQENGLFKIKAKIKNKSNSKIENFSVAFYERDINSSLLEKLYLSLDPEEIVEKIIYFIPTSETGEVFVIIDEENIINEVDKTNNFANKKFSKTKKLGSIYDTETNLIINTTPKEANVSDLFKITMKLTDTNASNAYVYYRYEDTNNSFYIVKMNNEGNGIYSCDIDILGRKILFYYFEVDTEFGIIKSPSESPQNFYSINVHYKETSKETKDKSFIENMKRILKII